MKKHTNTTRPPATLDMREQLKTILCAELERLPDTLENLEPKERVMLICRLMPFVFPKIETIHHSDGESNFMWNNH
jgi:hypothetical protein